MKTKRNRPSYAAVLAASDAALLAAYKRGLLAYNRDKSRDAKRAAADAYDAARETAEAYHA